MLRFEHVDVVFGSRPKQALALLDQGEGRDQIFEKTGNIVAVHDVCLDVAEGEICVLMGLSGSGKSSLLRCINGLNRVTRGKVLVRDGGREVNVAACPAETLRRLRRASISMVFQQFALMPWRTVRDNVAFGLEIRGAPKAERERAVEEKLALVRLDKWADKYPHELSGGMQQRVGLARAFATDASILLMDEPFSALDPLIREHLQDELMELQRTLRKTIVFVSHDLDEALKIGSRIAIMEAGRIVQYGTPEEIVTAPKDDYVRQFVASMNPLNVLTAGTLMRNVEALRRASAEAALPAPLLMLDRAGRCRCRLNSAGRPLDLTIEGRAGQFVAYTPDLDLDALPANAMVSGDTRTPMRIAILVRQRTRRPLVVLGEQGELLGCVGEHEIYRGMLRQFHLGRDEPAPAPAAAEV
ncbi:MAG: choline ABC transporter ATP-binding protein [Rhodospirillaceae bacterium]|nr:choline ABC transporter ATP-binding protein [Rhodospirillaceae bacterium]